MKLNRRDLCCAEGESDRNSFLFRRRAFPARNLPIQLCSLLRACTYSRMLHLLVSLVLFCLSHPLWLVDVATRVLWKLSQKGRKVGRVGGKFRGEQPRFHFFTGTRLHGGPLFFHERHV